MRYLLAIAATKPERFERALGSFLRRVKPQPSFVFVFDRGKKVGVERMIRDGYRIGDVGAYLIDGHRGNDPSAVLWAQAGRVSFDFSFLLHDEYEFQRGLDLRGPGQLLSLERVAQVAFPPLGETLAATDVTLRGSGGATWLEHRWGIPGAPTPWPALVPRRIADSFPWPDGGAQSLSDGIFAAVPGTTFALWGNGDPWVRRLD